MFSVNQHWDPLRVCVVGRSYPPEFYSWIKVPHVRSLFEKIAIETEEDYQHIIKKLQSFGVQVIRPSITENFEDLKNLDGRYPVPPMTPRDHTVMIGNKFYHTIFSINDFYQKVRDESWPEYCETWADFRRLPQRIQDECYHVHGLSDSDQKFSDPAWYREMFDLVRDQGNKIIDSTKPYTVSGAMVARIGKDLFFGTESYNQDTSGMQHYLEREFPDRRSHIVNTGGHSDGTYCPVCPGLIISLRDVPTYANTFPGWEVVYLPGQSWDAVKPFLSLRAKNHGKWWIPGFEHDTAVIDTVETWLKDWVGFVEETVFDVNMLIIDPKNVMVFNYNKQVFDALERYGITPHVVPFRHRYFWDGGIHCVTSDLHREGEMKDFFPGR